MAEGWNEIGGAGQVALAVTSLSRACAGRGSGWAVDWIAPGALGVDGRFAAGRASSTGRDAGRFGSIGRDAGRAGSAGCDTVRDGGKTGCNPGPDAGRAPNRCISTASVSWLLPGHRTGPTGAWPSDGTAVDRSDRGEAGRTRADSASWPGFFAAWTAIAAARLCQAVMSNRAVPAESYARRSTPEKPRVSRSSRVKGSIPARLVTDSQRSAKPVPPSVTPWRTTQPTRPTVGIETLRGRTVTSIDSFKWG